MINSNVKMFTGIWASLLPDQILREALWALQDLILWPGELVDIAVYFLNNFYMFRNTVYHLTSVLPCRVCKHWPVVMSHTLTVESAFPETSMLSFSSSPLVNDWWPIKVCRQFPDSTSHTRMEVSKDPLTMWTPSN